MGDATVIPFDFIVLMTLAGTGRSCFGDALSNAPLHAARSDPAKIIPMVFIALIFKSMHPYKFQTSE